MWTHQFRTLSPLTCLIKNRMKWSYLVMSLTSQECSWFLKPHACDPDIFTNNQIQRHFVVKAAFVLQTAFFQGSALYWSASARTHESSFIKASAQNATQHHSCHSLMGCFIQPSNHMRNSEKCFAEDNWVENYGLMKHMHLTAVKFQPVSALLSNSINLFPMTIHTNLQLWE